MRFEKGDKIVVKLTQEDGVVVDILNEEMVMVEVRGVQFPAYINMLESPYFKLFSTQRQKNTPVTPKRVYVDQIKKEKTAPQVDKMRQSDGIWIQFLPHFVTDEFEDEVVDYFKVFLLNHSPLDFQFHYKLFFLGEPDFELTNTIHSFQDFYLHDVPFSELSDNPNFTFDFSLVKEDKLRASHFECSYKIKPKQLFQTLERIKQNGEPGFKHQLMDRYPDRPNDEPKASSGLDFSGLKKMGYKVYDATRIKDHLEPISGIIDLHIERLVKDHHLWDADTILLYQLETLEKQIDLSLAHSSSSLIVIHGNGSGALRDAIHERLRRHPQVNYFVNQYDPRFGYGATEVFFK